MKLLGLLVAVLASASVFATPAVGDLSLFNVKIEQNGAFMEGTYEVALTAADASGGFKMQTIVTLEGQEPNVSEAVVEKKNLLTDAQIAEVLTNCPSYGGTLVSYTGPTFTASACELPQQNDKGEAAGEIFIAAVPFGIVKQIELEPSTGRTTTLELQKFTVGK